jgi:hypothetical protein
MIFKMLLLIGCWNPFILKNNIKIFLIFCVIYIHPMSSVITKQALFFESWKIDMFLKVIFFKYEFDQWADKHSFGSLVYQTINHYLIGGVHIYDDTIPF